MSFPYSLTSGPIAAAQQSVGLEVLGNATLSVQVAGTWVGTLIVEVSDDRATWQTVPVAPVGTTANAATITANGAWRADVDGLRYARVRASAWTSGTATVVLAASAAAWTGGVATIATNPLATETLANIPNSLTNVTLAAANTARRAFKVFNDGTTGNLFVKHGATASLTSFTVKIAPGGYYEMATPIYPGIVDGIWDAAGSVARVTEGT